MKIPRLNVGFIWGNENRFEANTFLANLSLGCCFRTLANIANCFNILLRESVFITVTSYTIVEDVEGDPWVLLFCILIVISILK
jgi:hypothetical protein